MNEADIYPGELGISLLDYIACQALPALIAAWAGSELPEEEDFHHMAEQAYELARAMLAERRKAKAKAPVKEGEGEE